MLGRLTRVQLMVFAILAAAALTVGAVDYVRLPQLLGFGQYSVYADFADVSGLYPHALVTYRGVDVGVVDELHLSTRGVRVTLRINDGTTIPGGTRAQIHSTSAIGEQFVDLVPSDSHGPYLHDGSTIPRDRTTGMPQTAPLLDSVDALLRSIPTSRLTSVLHEVDAAFSGTGPRLHTLLLDSRSLVARATADLAPTLHLLNVLAPFFNTQHDIASGLTTSVGDLASFADQLVVSNHDIERFLTRTPRFATEFTGLVGDLTPTLPALLDNLITTGGVVRAYLPGVRQLLVLLPPGVASLQSAFLRDSALQSIALDFKLNINDPPPCTTGFLPVPQRRDPSRTDETTTPPGLYCAVPESDPRVVRGARNTPCARYPGYRAATPAICAEEATGAAPRAPSATSVAAPHGVARSSPAVRVTVARTWQQLLRSLVGK